MSDATVTDLAKRRRADDVLSSITFVFGGIHHGTIPVRLPYARGRPIVLYLVPQRAGAGDDLTGPLDCLVTDDAALAAGFDLAK